MERKNTLLILLVISLLLTASLACRQSGEILTPAEATQRAEATAAAKTGDVITSVEGADFAPGDKAILISEGHLVGMYQEAGSRTAFSFATRGDEVTIVGSLDVDGVIWYRIESIAGKGWLPETNLTTE